MFNWIINIFKRRTASGAAAITQRPGGVRDTALAGQTDMATSMALGMVTGVPNLGPSLSGSLLGSVLADHVDACEDGCAEDPPEQGLADGAAGSGFCDSD